MQAGLRDFADYCGALVTGVTYAGNESFRLSGGDGYQQAARCLRIEQQLLDSERKAAHVSVRAGAVAVALPGGGQQVFVSVLHRFRDDGERVGVQDDGYRVPGHLQRVNDQPKAGNIRAGAYVESHHALAGAPVQPLH